MKSALLFVTMATIAVANCAPQSLVDVKVHRNADSNQALKLFKLVVCQDKESDEGPVGVSELYKLHEEIVRKFPEESLKEVKKVYCAEESAGPVMEDFNVDTNRYGSRSLIDLDSLVVPIATTGNTPIVSTEVPCQRPLWDNNNCDLECFLAKKHAYKRCVLHNYWNNVLLNLGLPRSG